MTFTPTVTMALAEYQDMVLIAKRRDEDLRRCREAISKLTAQLQRVRDAALPAPERPFSGLQINSTSGPGLKFGPYQDYGTYGGPSRTEPGPLKCEAY